ncbi:MAG TPA: radical SAM protein [Myxococcales bacterium]
MLARALEALRGLPGRWEIKISGGEPFLLGSLEDVARRLAQAGHKVSLLTNLSAPLERIERFIASAGERLRTFSCSLHLEQAREEAFLEKVLAVRARLASLSKASLVVNSVVVPGAVERLGEVRRRFEAAGLKFYPQLMRVDGAPHAYSADDAKAIAPAFGDLVGPKQMNRGYDLRGRLCHAGAKYFIVHPGGRAYSCYPGKRSGDGDLGSLFEGSFALRPGPMPCPYPACPCTVPQNRGIVDLPAGLRAPRAETE